MKNSRLGEKLQSVKPAIRSLLVRMPFDPRNQKKPYVPPALKKVDTEQARRFVIDHSHCGDQEALDLLESLRREQQQKEK
jgi:hypothetical protein